MKIALQLVGSPTSDFYFKLSILYARGVVQPEGFQLLFAICYPDGLWSIAPTIQQNLKRISITELIIEAQKADIIVPHLFCEKGLISMRIFFEEILNIPLVGSSGMVLAKAQDKLLTKLIAQSIDVSVPEGIKIEKKDYLIDDYKKLKFPVVVKPNNCDNSDGLSLVYNFKELDRAVKESFKFNDQILVENFIDGRELRGALICIEGGLEALPFIEYKVSDIHPIRNPADKLKISSSTETMTLSDKINIPAHCPAKLDSILEKELIDIMKKMHSSLDCRDFSMYDFRIDKITGRPYLLEAGLFWSFSEKSIISKMLKENNKDLKTITQKIWEMKISEKQNIG